MSALNLPMKNFFTFTSTIFFLCFLSSCAYQKSFGSFFRSNVKPVSCSADQFVQGSEDIPLFHDMKKISDDSLGFDSQSGSVTSSTYQTEASEKEVRSFYVATLPQMGWKIVKDSKNKIEMKREKHHLEIEFLQEDKKRLVKFFISSATE